MNTDLSFDLSSYFSVLQKEINAYGLNVELIQKEKTKDSTISSAFLKGNTREHILLFYSDEKFAKTIASNEVIKIKFEIDINPPAGARYEDKYQILPSPYAIKLYDQPSLFAGKIHAVICRSWQNRIKGRDLYDYVFYLSRGAKVNINHLHARLIDSGYLNALEPFDIGILKIILSNKFDSIDYVSAKEDVRNFITDKASLDVWGPEFFKHITETLQAC